MYTRENLLLRAKELEKAVETENAKILLGRNKTTGMRKTMVKKAKEDEDKFLKFIENKSNTLFDRYNVLQEKEAKEKQNLSMLERDIANGNEYMKLGRRQRKNPSVGQVVDTEGTYAVEHDDKLDKIIHYAEKYNIKFSNGFGKKSFKELVKEIHAYEMRNIKKLKKLGLDKKYHEYGMYINIV
jgi:hypothetical protein